MEIRKGKKRDVEGIGELLEEYPVPMEEVKKNLGAGMVYVAEEKGKIIGFADGKVQEDKAYGRILHFFVKKEYRGRGIATKLLEELKKEFKNRNIKTVSLECAIMDKKQES
ncbi:GNAT family N-acetyltransferase [Candidatus Micrarchaeota archaeon]|nr:GNAT family N-acetyltransferase [Candidatus Micrarchaeota archaeon]